MAAAKLEVEVEAEPEVGVVLFSCCCSHHTTSLEVSTAKLLSPYPFLAFAVQRFASSTGLDSKQGSCFTTDEGSFASDWPFLPCHSNFGSLENSSSCCSLLDDRLCCCSVGSSRD